MPLPKAPKPYWQLIGTTKKIEFYKSLVTKNYFEAAKEIGMDKHYQPITLRSIGYQLYKSIDPKELGISEDIVKMVQEAIAQRKMSKTVKVKEDTTDILFTPSEMINPEDNKQVVIHGRNKAAMLLHKKMDRINSNKKLLDAVSLTQLATTFAIMFDKAQIINGQATENIAVMAKIDDNLSPEQALDMVLQMREREVAEKSEQK
jgi:hypothetical protein